MCGSCGRKIQLDEPGSSTRSHGSIETKPTARPTRFGTHAAMDGSVVAFETQEAWVQHLTHQTESAAHRALRRRKRVIGGLSCNPAAVVRSPDNALSRQQSSADGYQRPHTSTTPSYMHPRRTGIPGSRCGSQQALVVACLSSCCFRGLRRTACAC